jgi:hypothetical protein
LIGLQNKGSELGSDTAGMVFRMARFTKTQMACVAIGLRGRLHLRGAAEAEGVGLLAHRVDAEGDVIVERDA